MDHKQIEAYIHSAIPVVKTMGISIQKITTDYCIVSVPLEPNHNHKGTAFGGSLYSASVVACYALVYALQKAAGLNQHHLVIRDGRIQYFKPVTEDFTVMAQVDAAAWQKLLESLESKKAARIPMTSEAKIADLTCATFQGDFVLVL